jgi:hypothetical protein
MGVLRWRLQDPSDPSPAGTYRFPWNPQKQTPPFPERAITTQATTAIDGQILLWEGMAQPAAWTFSGVIKDAAHYEALRSWVYDRQGRLFLYDHFGRRLVIVMKAFKPSAEANVKVGRYWHHSYDVDALVLSVSQPTVGDEGPQ